MWACFFKVHETAVLAAANKNLSEWVVGTIEMEMRKG